MKTFVVLGMHRSDTSRVSKGLSGENVHLGDDMLEPDVHNPLGYHETTSSVAQRRHPQGRGRRVG